MKRSIIVIGVLTLCLAVFSTCKKDPEVNIEEFEIVTEALTAGATSVNIEGTYSYPGKIEGIKTFVSDNESFAHAKSFEAELSSNNAFSIKITDLQTATVYYYYYSIDYGFSKPYKTETKIFITQSEAPSVMTVGTVAIDSINVRVLCKVVADGGQSVTERGICWNTYGNPNLDDDTLHYHSAGLGDYSCQLKNLEYATTYFVRAYARNASGIGFGEVLEFKTGTEVTPPQVSTVEIIGVTYNSAQCLGNVASDGGGQLIEIGACWSTQPNPSINSHHVAASVNETGNFTVTLTNLLPQTTYYVRCYATNPKGTAYGETITFATVEGLPVVSTSGITNITATSAKGGGNVTDQGASNVTERGICWSTSHNPSIADTHASNGTGVGNYTVSMNGLTPNATYYVRAYATNTQGTSYGAEVSFTAMEGLPVVTTSEVTNVTATSAKCGGNVTDQGGSAVVERGVCWSEDHNPTTSGSHVSSGSGAGSFTCNMTGLTNGTTYYVRAYAKNTQGTTYGEEKEFTTSANLPTVVTGSISGTTVNGSVTDDGGATVTERGVCWSTSHNPTTSGAHGSNGSGIGNYSVTLTNLNPGTTYYVRAYAVNSAGTAYGEEKSLTTDAVLPTVTTGTVTNVTQTTAQGSGNVTDSGGASVTERGVCWSTSHNPTTSGSHASNGTGTGSFTVDMTGLTANTTYYVRAYAKNSAGTNYGNEVTFTSSQTTSSPSVTTAAVTNIAQTTAMGGGTVTSDGGAAVTERGICWSTSSNPTTSGSHATSGTGTGSFTVNMTGLTAGTTYHVRAYAINSQGTSYGSDKTFTTSQVSNYTIAVSANPSGAGTVSGGGSYQQGQSCTVSATANTGYTFTNWTESGTVVSANVNYTFTVSANRTLVANFTANPQSYTINVSANPVEGGTVSGSGIYQHGQTCTVYASSNCSSSFNGWTENGVVVSSNASYSFTVTNDRTLVATFTYNTAGGHNYVDMGLPSGVLWATCNIGANTPQSYGNYYAWGAVSSGGGSWYNYPYCHGTNNTLTKYCNNSNFGYNGFTDDLVVLLAEDDAATTNWDNGWRIPSIADWHELLNETNTYWTTLNDVNGLLVVANNGNRIFLPAAGAQIPSLNGAGDAGYYWSSSLSGSTPDKAQMLYFYSGWGGMVNCGLDNERKDGIPIRPVRSSSNPQNCLISVSSDPTSGGNVTGGGTYQQGQTCTVSATANMGYSFTNWTENGSQVSTNANYTFTVNGNRTLVANFTASSTAPTGAINGLFSVAAGRQVYFAKGNLQYKASTNTWRFADNQWDYVGGINNGVHNGNVSGSSNDDISSAYSGWIDLFGWGTSGYNHGAVCYQPWSISNSVSDYYAYGNVGRDLYNESGQADWGYNAISNGGNQENSGWRTLTQSEWDYVINTRSTSSGIRFAKARVNGVNGVLLLPDDWSSSIYSLNYVNNVNSTYSSNQISSSVWENTLESNGAVFLPAAGVRSIDSQSMGCYHMNEMGYYWSSKHYDYQSAYLLIFYDDNYLNTDNYVYRPEGLSVRLVQTHQ